MASSVVAHSQNTLSGSGPSTVAVLLDILERSMHASRFEWLFFRVTGRDLPAGSGLMFDVVADPIFVGGRRLNAGRFHDLQERLHSGR